MSQIARGGFAPLMASMTAPPPVRELIQDDVESRGNEQLAFTVLCDMRARMKEVWERAQAAGSPVVRSSRLSGPSDLLMGALQALVGRMDVVKSVVSAAPNLSTVLRRSPARPQEIIEWHQQWSSVLTMLVSSQICTTIPATAHKIAEAVACVTDDLWPYIMEWQLAALNRGHRCKVLLDLKSDFIDRAAQFSGGLDLLGRELREGLPFTEELEDFLQEVVKGVQVINRTLRDELGKALAELESPGGGSSCFSSRWARVALFTTATLSRALSMIFGALSVANPPEDEQSSSDSGIRPMALARFITAGGALASIVGYSWLRERSLASLEDERNLRSACRDLLECQSLLQLLVVNTEPDVPELPPRLSAASLVPDEAHVEPPVDGLDDAHMGQEGSERPAALDEPNLQKWHEGIRHLAGEARKIVGPLAHGLESCNQLVELQEEPDCDPHTLGRALQVQEESLTGLVHRGESLTKRISELRESMEDDHRDGCCRQTRPLLALLQYSDGILAFLAFLGGGVDAFSSFSTAAVRGISITNTALDGFNNFVGLTRELAQSRAERHENTLNQLTEAFGELSRVVPLAGPLAKTYALISRKLLESTRSPSVFTQVSGVPSERTFRSERRSSRDSFGMTPLAAAPLRQDSLVEREDSGNFDLSDLSELSVSCVRPEDVVLGDDGEVVARRTSTPITEVLVLRNEPLRQEFLSRLASIETMHRPESEEDLGHLNDESGEEVISYTKFMPGARVLGAEHTLFKPECSVPIAVPIMTSAYSPKREAPSGVGQQGPASGDAQSLQSLVRRARGLFPSAVSQTVGKKR